MSLPDPNSAPTSSAVGAPPASVPTVDDAAGTATSLASWVYALLQPGGHSPLVRWMIAGGAFMGLSTLFLYLAVGLLGMPVMVGTLVSAELCTLLRYLVNDHWVFGHPKPSWRRLWQYHVANGAAFGIWWVATNAMNLLGVHYLLAGILAVGFSTGFSMGTNFFWIWRKKHHPPAP
jgi:putative flippase GtrA